MAACSATISREEPPISESTGLTEDPSPQRRIQLDEIHKQLRDRICLLEYAPGSLLRESDLAAEFGVSRTPIREVLQRLAHEDLVESKNGVGTIVTALDYRKIKDVYEMRLRIASLIGDLSPNGIEMRHIERVERLLERARRLVRAFDIKAYWQINHDLHFLIGELIGNSALQVMWDRFYFQAARMWYDLARDLGREVSRSLIREIEDVLEAARDGDVRAIGYIQRNYIAYGLRHVIARYEKTPTAVPAESQRTPRRIRGARKGRA